MRWGSKGARKRALVAAKRGDLARAREQARAARLQRCAFAHHAELEGEPVDALELQHARLVGVRGGAAEGAAEFGVAGIQQAGGVADQLVDDVGLRGVERPRMVADVLGREEDALPELREEVARG